MKCWLLNRLSSIGFWEVAGELLGMSGRVMNMDLQIFLSENDTRFPFSDVLYTDKKNYNIFTIIIVKSSVFNPRTGWVTVGFF
jgi:hypothetical protein